MSALPSEPTDSASFGEAMNTRQCVIDRKIELRTVAGDLSQEARTHLANSPERNRLFRVIQAQQDEQHALEDVLSTDFVPQHGPLQLLSPRAFFVSPLFRVASRQRTRERSVSLELKNSQGVSVLKYTGPELRQSDGLIFMALLNLARDVRAGTPVSFSAESVCRSAFDRYDGPTRNMLRDHIKRLQRSLIEFEHFSVQMCLRFQYPARGAWSVALDKEIVQLFHRSAEVWLELPLRKALPEGLATWLYAYVESQTKLIPTSFGKLKELCGSDASDESFPRTLRLALKELDKHQIIDSGWTMKGGVVHWRKKTASGVAATKLLLGTP